MTASTPPLKNSRKPTGKTKKVILVESQILIQKFGFQGFSLQMLADQVGIKKPTLFDHYPSKEAIVLEILENYYQQFYQWTEANKYLTPDKKIKSYFDLYFVFAKDHYKMCPLMALASDQQQLPPKLKRKLTAFSDRMVNWLQKTILDGQKIGLFNHKQFSSVYANMAFSLALGGQIFSRIESDNLICKNMSSQFLKLIER